MAYEKEEEEEAIRKHTQKLGVHIKTDMFLQNSLLIENTRISG